MKTARPTHTGRPAGRPLGAWLSCLAAVQALLLAPCAAPAASATELFVAAAASLREPIEAIAAEHRQENPGLRLHLGFGASSALAAQIRMGAPVDVLLSADPAIVDDLAARARVDATSRIDFASNRLVVIRSAASTLTFSRPEDLLGPDLGLLALPGTAVPLGRYAREWLAAHRLLDGLASRIVLTEDARATLTAVDSGNADAAIVYATDARRALRARIVHEIPDVEQPHIVYTAVLTIRARDPAAARLFVARLRSPTSQNLLREAGFGPISDRTGAATP